MRRLGKSVTRLAMRTIPDLPPDIRHEFFVSAAHQMQRQGRLLFVFFLALIPLAFVVASPDAHWLLRWGLPAAMALYSLAGLSQLSRRFDFESDSRCARRFVMLCATASCIGAAICCFWALASWFGAEGGERLQYPVIVVMSVLASAYCLANVRIGAVLNIAIAILPIALTLIAFGSPLDRAAGISFLLGGLFQWRMIDVHTHQVIALLKLQRQSQKLALTDPLTGLLNRRALQNFVDDLEESRAHTRVMLVDIDHFKTINDTFGHDMGDRVLVEFAELLEEFAGHDALAARVGGEEFALVGSREALPCETAEQLLECIRATTFSHGEPVTASIGMATGQLGNTAHWPDLRAQADSALYRAKNSGRDRWIVADAPDADTGMKGGVGSSPGCGTIEAPANESGDASKVA